jgi:uncharacterized protein (DUF2252 family)
METITGLGQHRPIETAASQRARGKAARRDVPRAAHAVFTPVDRDPVALVEAQNEGRLQDLVPLRRERMSVSPFTFYRGSAGLMAHDLARQTVTGVHVVICGDAHLSNFGLYASPERRLVFDLNDFDEAAPGPWEWDVKRLVTSVVLGGSELGLGSKSVRAAALACATAYREAIGRVVAMDTLEGYYVRADEDAIMGALRKSSRAAFDAIASKARTRTSAQATAKMTETDAEGRVRFREEPPVLTHIKPAEERQVEALFEQYRGTVRPDVALLLSRYAPTDIARRVVGVGSVGTRCYVVVLTGANGDHLILQVKQANSSVIATAMTPNETTPRPVPPDAPHGQRVTANQQVLQAVSDPFLGHLEANGRDYYVRQFWDMKGSLEISGMSAAGFTEYVTACARLLARGHGQSPLVHWVAGYLGGSPEYDQAVVDWSFAYAKQVALDFAAFTSGQPSKSTPRTAPKA